MAGSAASWPVAATTNTAKSVDAFVSAAEAAGRPAVRKSPSNNARTPLKGRSSLASKPGRLTATLRAKRFTTMSRKTTGFCGKLTRMVCVV
ncbi:MAG: hypothetical protein EBY09_05625 [Verrucomicrobia bacterium]|nr:hypothetical protein [Verrucomicrobiota bacterium]